MNTIRLLFVLTMVCIMTSNSPSHGQASDEVILVPEDDPKMAAAIAKARGTIATFWRSFEKPGPGEGSYALKVGISDKGHVEFFWLTDIERKASAFVGTINNEPATVRSVKLNQRYTFTQAEIVDWLFMRHGKMVGNETMRPLLDQMPKDQAERYRAMYEKP